MDTDSIKGYVASRIKHYRKAAGLTQKELGEKIGVKHNTISSYEGGKNEPEQNMLFKIASALGISVNDLFPPTEGSETTSNETEPISQPSSITYTLPPSHGDDSVMVPIPGGYRIPVLGKVVAGVPINAITDISGFEEIPEQMGRAGEFFALEIKGRSMAPTLHEGDVVIVRQQPNVENGEIAIVLINGNEATVKEVKESPDGLTLIGHNVAIYTPHFYNRQEIESLPIQILGKVVELRRKF